MNTKAETRNPFAAGTKYLLMFSATLLAVLSFALSSCGRGGGEVPPAPPFIGAQLSNFPTGFVPPGLTTGASVVVLNDSNGDSITTATVTMNGVNLTYNAINRDYEGDVVVPPGGAVTLSVTDASGTYTVSTTQFTSYPTVLAPASGDTWDSSAANTVMWSGGAPTANAEYVFGILDATDPNGLVQWPDSNFLQEVPLATTSFSIPAVSIPGGSRSMIVGIASSGTPIPNAAPGSSLFVAGFNYVPITVTGFPVTVRTMGATAFPVSVASSNSQFVAVGGSVASPGAAPTSGVFTSLDGITWTSRGAGASEPLHGIAWSGMQFVAVGLNGTILTSLDGVTWTTRLAGTTADLSGVAWSGTQSQFVAVGGISGSSGTILTSPDGITWTSQASGTSANLSAVAWSGTTFVAVGTGGSSGGTILTSSDGVNWTVQTSGLPSFLDGVAWSGTQFAVVGTQVTPCCSDVILTSPGGVTWTPRSSGASAFPHAVVWAGAEFVAVGGSGGIPGTILTSSDGVTWTPRASGTANNLTGVAWSGTKLVAVGGAGAVLTSP